MTDADIITFHLDPAITFQLDDLARARSVEDSKFITRSALIREAIRDYLGAHGVTIKEELERR